MSLLDQIPNYRDAVETEQLVRDAAFLGVNDSIAGFEVRPMALSQYLLLRMMKSPLLTFTMPTPKELTAFLWLLSPDYTPAGGKPRRKFFRRCRRFTLPDMPWIKTTRSKLRWVKTAKIRMKIFANTVADARRYVAETFQDRPASVPAVQDEPAYYSDAASICGALARDYGWREKDILNIPLKRLFQYLKEIGQANGKKIFFNPSDEIKADWLLEQNRLAQHN